MIALFVIIYLFRVVASLADKTVSNEREDKILRFVIACLWPVFLMARVYVWNTWVSGLIDWPQITTLEQLFFTLLIL